MLILYILSCILAFVLSFLGITKNQRNFTLKDLIVSSGFSLLGPFALFIYIAVCWEDIGKSLDNVVLYKRKVK